MLLAAGSDFNTEQATSLRSLQDTARNIIRKQLKDTHPDKNLLLCSCELQMSSTPRSKMLKKFPQLSECPNV